MLQVQTMLPGEGQSDCELGHRVVADRCSAASAHSRHTLVLFFHFREMGLSEGSRSSRSPEGRRVEFRQLDLFLVTLERFRLSLERLLVVQHPGPSNTLQN